MPRINIFITDTDKFYSESLGKYLSSSSRNFNISIFTNITAMQKEISTSKKIPDIILISEDFYSPDTAFGKCTFILTDKNSDTADRNYIYKYQTAESILDKISKHIEKYSVNESAVEFGCGTGLVGFQLIENFKSITFVDSSSGMIEQVNKKISGQGIKTASALNA
jgi:tRNA/tmRNA/rRNA uracil-C5-methylase (TrmA/RlmC/RlmD family)